MEICHIKINNNNESNRLRGLFPLQNSSSFFTADLLSEVVDVLMPHFLPHFCACVGPELHFISRALHFSFESITDAALLEQQGIRNIICLMDWRAFLYLLQMCSTRVFCLKSGMKFEPQQLLTESFRPAFKNRLKGTLLTPHFEGLLLICSSYSASNTQGNKIVVHILKRKHF